MQAGYVLGYLLAAVASMCMTSVYGWQSVYYCGASISLLAAALRAALPESRQYILAREELKAEGLTTSEAQSRFFKELKIMLKLNWLRCVWGVLLMTGFNT
jgi:SHS family lactate transporter-like MFS transporter